jgi:transposase InsO family protein
MAYTTNEKVGRVRAQAVRMVRSGKSTREVARYFGYVQSTIVKWCKRAPRAFKQNGILETFSSRPHTSPRRTPLEIEARVIATREKSKRCSEVIYEILKAEGISISLSSVKRILSRYGCLKKRSPWKKKRVYPLRPNVKSQGDLVEFDTIHFVDKDGKRSYVYTALDVYSRYGFAMLSQKSNCHRSTQFLKKAQNYFPFDITCIQTDNGPEFGLHFTDVVKRMGMTHRHNHPRSPNENGHLERFNRTLQEEIPRHNLCIFLPKDVSKFLTHYNTKRMHMGIKFKTPSQMLQK